MNLPTHREMSLVSPTSAKLSATTQVPVRSLPLSIRIEYRARVLIGNDAKFLAFLERLAPNSYWKFSRLMPRS